ncbi:MAG TPA: limonene-1,2-epoxide hydrolase family protein [Alphaproteobacteria bacterium]|nr:limonene-1,2-epoxide hydrolase family protein [Alphaproteobacteria bacterium]
MNRRSGAVEGSKGSMRVTRRDVVAAGGLGAFALAVSQIAQGAPPADMPANGAPPMSPNLNGPSAASAATIEKANIQLVKDFCKAWGDDPPDPDDMAAKYLADDCVVRFGDTIDPVTGHDAAIALFQTFLSSGERYDLKILETFARGPVVVNSRIDSTIKGTRTTHPTSVVGVFIVRNGKIKEWSDYV